MYDGNSRQLMQINAVSEDSKELDLLMIDYLRFYVPLKNFHLYGGVTIAGKSL
jgi:hypothetical protein